MKTNKLYGWIAAVAMIFSMNMAAQQADKKTFTPEERLNNRIERMRKELMLDDATAAKFETVYKNYTNELKACFPTTEMKQPSKKKDRKLLSDQELDKVMTERLDNQIKIAQIKKKYHVEFKKFLNMKQVERLYSCERKGFEMNHKGNAPRMERQMKEKHRGVGKRVCDDGENFEKDEHPGISKR